MKGIPITRASHLLPYVECLRQIGVPVERELERSRLSPALIGQPDMLVPGLPVMHFLQQTGQRQGLEELGLLGTYKMEITQLSGGFLRQAQHALTLSAMLELFSKLVYLEDPLVRYWLDGQTDMVRICNSIDFPTDTPGLEYCEWIQNMVGVAMVRACAGRHWHPIEMAFRSRMHPGRFAQEQFPGTRFLVGQPCAWISMPRASLSLSPQKNGNSSDPHHLSLPDQVVSIEDFTSLPGSLKLLLKPYIREGYPHIQLAAEMADVSVRTLQRRLGDEGLDYSTLINQVRLESAMRLLKDRHLKVIDVAYEVGYEDPSNFARAFRALTGLSPREFQHHAVEGVNGK